MDIKDLVALANAGYTKDDIAKILQPAAQPIAQPAAQPIAQPAAQPIAQPAAQPIAQPIAQPAAQPIAQPAAQPIAQPANITDQIAAQTAAINNLIRTMQASNIAAANGGQPQTESVDDMLTKILGGK